MYKSLFTLWLFAVTCVSTAALADDQVLLPFESTGLRYLKYNKTISELLSEYPDILGVEYSDSGWETGTAPFCSWYPSSGHEIHLCHNPFLGTQWDAALIVSRFWIELPESFDNVRITTRCSFKSYIYVNGVEAYLPYMNFNDCPYLELTRPIDNELLHPGSNLFVVIHEQYYEEAGPGIGPYGDPVWRYMDFQVAGDISDDVGAESHTWGEIKRILLHQSLLSR